uniref:non-specific serine/threonine protein kinase n=1 Tax=Angiostrongylus cantonensis TaxID=6313 RepID=A0A0K0DB02_ANGCA
MVVKLIIAYPFHVLHTVLMYKFDEVTFNFVRSNFYKSARARLHQIIEDMIAAHIAYIQFATLKISDTQFFKKISGVKTGILFLCISQQFCRTGFFFYSHVLLTSVKIGNAGDYSGHEIVMWDTMDPTCTRADGLSSPKVLRAKGSDGKWYKLIWKNEDVRQDCLVEQLFSVVISNLRMSLATYGDFDFLIQVIPLNSKCGIIEFCQGTISLKELLCGLDLAGGLHAKAEPRDKKALQIRTILKDVAKMPVNQASMCHRVFEIYWTCRHFFYHHCRSVNQWTSMIDNYRRSLAQWSIATYVVGLGDRHLSNILFEIDTCKLVHIDLGMILEYSKRTLPIPERVPFRLTRDLLDPILIEGIGGRLLEEAVCAMQLLRENNSKVILGLASVLLRETITNFEEVESNNGDRPSFVSETAIARLRDKLSGTDDTFVQQDVQHQVRRLFTEATNVDNISRMFIGWMGFV